MIRYGLKELALVLGIAPNTTSHREKWLAALGGGLGIALVYAIAGTVGDFHTSLLIVASMGASAVLVFAVPHGALSQPWPVLGGHTLSALVGVTCALEFNATLFAGALAVCLSISVMFYLRCLHPPGGATALLAVVGGPAVHKLGYGFVVFPILVNSFTLLVAVILFNQCFNGRTYPAHGFSRQQRLHSHHRARRANSLTQEDVVAAMQQMDSFIDISAEDLGELFTLAQSHAKVTTLLPLLEAGRCYSNGELGQSWAVRQITALEGKHVQYCIVAGQDQGQVARCPRSQFEIWAHHAVAFNQGHWQKDTRPSEVAKVI
ncbi:MAG: HPP family protein [Hahellaceae bacterium]|nr:HPP family protein [Hahellaceae bacterium]